MENVHFLNIEYFLLRAYDFFFTAPAVQGTIDEVQAPASSAFHAISFFLWQVALAGMALTTVLIIAVVWVKVRIVLVEHEFEEREEEREHAHTGHGEESGERVPPRRGRWVGVLALANSANESDWRRAILEADTLLAELLDEQGYRGDGVGEKLRDANPLQFTTLDLAWEAHKVRNNVAHGGENFVLTQRDTKATIDLYRRVFEEFAFV